MVPRFDISPTSNTSTRPITFWNLLWKDVWTFLLSLFSYFQFIDAIGQSLLFLLRFWQVIDPLAIALGFASVEPWATFECCKSKRASWHVKYGEKTWKNHMNPTTWRILILTYFIPFLTRRVWSLDVTLQRKRWNCRTCSICCISMWLRIRSVKLVFCWEVAWQSGSGGSLLGWTFASLPSCCDKGARKNRCSGAAQ